MEPSRRGDVMAKREARRISREERLKERKEKKRAREKQRKEANGENNWCRRRGRRIDNSERIAV